MCCVIGDFMMICEIEQLWFMFILIQFLDLIENLTFDGAVQWLPKWIQITWYVHVSPCFNFASHYKNTFIYYL